jgi:drug/metabolite transporter (DMT)-like permease
MVGAAFVWSSAGVLQRSLSVGLATQVAGRAVFAVAALFAIVAIGERGRVVRAFRTMGRDALGFAALMGFSSGAFMTALNHTTVANVLFMQALAPIMSAGLAAVFLHEHITRRTLAAMAIAIVGVAVMVGAPGGASLAGDGLAFLMSLGFAGSIVFARRGRTVSMVPATCLSQALLLVAFGPFASPGQVGGHDLLLLAVFGSMQIGLGLLLFIVGARMLSAAEVALISLLEVVLGPLWVWLARSERPSTATIVGGVIVLAGVAVQIFQASTSDDQIPIEYPR